MGKSKSNKKSPARKRYEERNPVESFRAPRELHDRMQEVKKKDGLTNTDIVKIGLRLIEAKIRAEEEIRQEAHDEGWEKGVNAAEELYAVTYPCSRCGKKIVVTTDEEKEAIKGYMREAGWQHGDCNNPRY